MYILIKNLVLVCLIAANAEANAEGNSQTRQTDVHYFHLYTRQQSRVSLVVQPTSAGVRNAPILRTRNTVILIHGHLVDGTNFFSIVLKNALLTSEDLNIIAVDWEFYARDDYAAALKAVPNIGASVAAFIKLLLTYNKADLNRIHVIGFGLGAHVAGFCGRSLSTPVARITGLDPAAEGWVYSFERLRPNDAKYVEVIHTDTIGPNSIGLRNSSGHVDFYVNGGGNQPGCEDHLCNHNRAWEHFAASLTTERLIGRLCTINELTGRCTGFIVPLGKNVFEKYADGIFGVETGCVFPYDEPCTNDDSSDNGSGEDIFIT